MIPNGSARLATEVAGVGADVLLLHAGVADRRAWAPLVERLAPTNRCISFDARGYGETTYEPEAFSRVGDALAVLDATGSRRAILIGNSMGARAALDLAIAHPDRVEALVLVCPAISGMPEGEDSPEVQKVDQQMQAARLASHLAELNRIEARFWLDGINGGGDGRVAGAARELFLDMNGRALAARDPGDEHSDIDAWQQLERVAVPTLVVVGEFDYPVFTENAATAADRLPNGQLVRLGTAAHLPVLEADETCLRAITKFVAEQRANPSHDWAGLRHDYRFTT